MVHGKLNLIFNTSDCYSFDTQYDGNNNITLQNVTSVVQDCQVMCQGNKEANFFSWDSSNITKDPNNCLCMAVKGNVKATDGFISGPTVCGKY